MCTNNLQMQMNYNCIRNNIAIKQALLQQAEFGPTDSKYTYTKLNLWFYPSKCQNKMAANMAELWTNRTLLEISFGIRTF